MFSLRLLGGLELASSEGPVSGRMGQRRQLALLAALAVAGNRRTSRDKLLALLWPETDTERARHLLSDTIYVLREALGEDVVSTVGDDVVLNPLRVTSDVAEFRKALEGGDLAQAVRIYGAAGAFLDGVHVTDSAEFERWADSVRDELASDYRRALEQVALDAERRASYTEAVGAWRQLAAADRLSSRVAVGLMRALTAAGDRAGALEFSRTHERIVRAELDCEPDAAVVAFANELRAKDATRPKSADRTERLPQAQASDSPIAVPQAAEAPVGRSPVRQLGYGLVALLLLTTAGYGALLMRGRFARSAGSVADASLVVLPLADLSA
ncbi:MAG TPA: BTAD domain-containing putative transcriptional regulator, partial [Gemmatimonadaceae bacterium]